MVKTTEQHWCENYKRKFRSMFPSTHTLVDESGDSQKRYIRETGETVWAIMQFYTYHIVLLTPAAETHIVIDDEHEKFAFVSIAELGTYDMPEPSINLFKKMRYLS